MTVELRDQATKSIGELNAALPVLAARHGAAFAALPDMPTPHTIDGVHLDANGYLVWDKAIMQAAAGVCGGRSSVLRNRSGRVPLASILDASE